MDQFDLDVRIASPTKAAVAGPDSLTVATRLICTRVTCRSCTCVSCITQCPLACF